MKIISQYITHYVCLLIIFWFVHCLLFNSHHNIQIQRKAFVCWIKSTLCDRSVPKSPGIQQKLAQIDSPNSSECKKVVKCQVRGEGVAGNGFRLIPLDWKCKRAWPGWITRNGVSSDSARARFTYLPTFASCPNSIQRCSWTVNKIVLWRGNRTSKKRGTSREMLPVPTSA